jgi:hypothetical protein
LSLIGAILIIIGGIAMAAGWYIGLGNMGLGYVGAGVLGIIWGIIALIGAIVMNNSNKSRVRTGSILVLVFSILSWFGASGGFVAGFLLGVIGAILGLMWKPPTTEKPSPPAQPSPP